MSWDCCQSGGGAKELGMNLAVGRKRSILNSAFGPAEERRRCPGDTIDPDHSLPRSACCGRYSRGVRCIAWAAGDDTRRWDITTDQTCSRRSRRRKQECAIGHREPPSQGSCRGARLTGAAIPAESTIGKAISQRSRTPLPLAPSERASGRDPTEDPPLPGRSAAVESRRRATPTQGRSPPQRASAVRADPPCHSPAATTRRR